MTRRFIPALTLFALASPTLLAGAAPLAGARAASAPGVRVEVREDGRTYITNENAVQRERRQSNRLLPVPLMDLAEMISRHSQAQQLEPQLVRAVIQVESGYNPKALSNKGAMGLMQLTAATAKDLAVSNPYDPAENIRAGTAYLRALLDRFLRLELALAAYNAGPGAVEKYSGIPPYPETHDYIRRVLRLYRGIDEPLPMVSYNGTERRGRTPILVRENGRILITTDPP